MDEIDNILAHAVQKLAHTTEPHFNIDHGWIHFQQQEMKEFLTQKNTKKKKTIAICILVFVFAVAILVFQNQLISPSLYSTNTQHTKSKTIASPSLGHAKHNLNKTKSEIQNAGFAFRTQMLSSTLISKAKPSSIEPNRQDSLWESPPYDTQAAVHNSITIRGTSLFITDTFAFLQMAATQNLVIANQYQKHRKWGVEFQFLSGLPLQAQPFPGIVTGAALKKQLGSKFEMGVGLQYQYFPASYFYVSVPQQFVDGSGNVNIEYDSITISTRHKITLPLYLEWKKNLFPHWQLRSRIGTSLSSLQQNQKDSVRVIRHNQGIGPASVETFATAQKQYWEKNILELNPYIELSLNYSRNLHNIYCGLHYSYQGQFFLPQKMGSSGIFFQMGYRKTIWGK